MINKRDIKIKEAMNDCYIQMYKESEPPANFLELVENAVLNEYGEKVIPFNDYVISEARADQIIAEVAKKNKFNEYDKKTLSRSVWLGCSPKFKKE